MCDVTYRKPDESSVFVHRRCPMMRHGLLKMLHTWRRANENAIENFKNRFELTEITAKTNKRNNIFSILGSNH